MSHLIFLIPHQSNENAHIIKEAMKCISEIYDHQLRAFAKFSVMRKYGIRHSHQYFSCLGDTPSTPAAQFPFRLSLAES